MSKWSIVHRSHVRLVCSENMNHLECIDSKLSNGSDKIFKVNVITSRSAVKMTPQCRSHGRFICPENMKQLQFKSFHVRWSRHNFQVEAIVSKLNIKITLQCTVDLPYKYETVVMHIFLLLAWIWFRETGRMGGGIWARV